MNILFICKGNKFRSKTAEAYLKQNSKKSVVVKSAGIIVYDDLNEKLDKLIYEAAHQLGLTLKKRLHPVTHSLLMWADVIVSVADNVPIKLFKIDYAKDKKLIQWKIPDVYNDNVEDRKKVMKSVCKKVDGLIKELRLN